MAERFITANDQEMSKYFDNPAGIHDAILLLRNKNVVLVEDAPRVVDRLLGWLIMLANRLRYHRLRSTWGISGKLVVTEQIVENAWVLQELREEDRRIVDFGAVESVLPLQLSALGREVWVLDGRRYPFSHPKVHTLQADILQPTLPLTPPFDSAISISTIEHVGLGRYGDTVDERGDQRAVEALWHLLRPGGRLLATVPAGRPATQRGYRVYDEARVRAVFPSNSDVRWFLKPGRQGTWREVDAGDVAHIAYEKPFGEAPIEAVALIAATKL